MQYLRAGPFYWHLIFWPLANAQQLHSIHFELPNEWQYFRDCCHSLHQLLLELGLQLLLPCHFGQLCEALSCHGYQLFFISGYMLILKIILFFKLAVRLPDERSFYEPFFAVICPNLVLWSFWRIFDGIFWWVFWRIFLPNFFDENLTKFFDEVFDKCYDEFFWRIFWPIFLTNFLMNFLEEFFDYFFNRTFW